MRMWYFRYNNQSINSPENCENKEKVLFFPLKFLYIYILLLYFYKFLYFNKSFIKSLKINKVLFRKIEWNNSF